MEGVEATFDLATLGFTDADNGTYETLTYSATGQPSWVSVDFTNTGAEFTVNPVNGSAAEVVTITAEDSQGGTA